MEALMIHKKMQRYILYSVVSSKVIYIYEFIEVNSTFRGTFQDKSDNSDCNANLDYSGNCIGILAVTLFH